MVKHSKLKVLKQIETGETPLTMKHNEPVIMKHYEAIQMKHREAIMVKH